MHSARHPLSVAGTAASVSTQFSAERRQICRRGEKAARWVIVPTRSALALGIVHCAGIDRRAAITAEGVAAFVAAFRRLHITLRHAAAEHEMLGRRGDVYAERQSSERLTISAVADGQGRGIHLRLEGDLTAMAVSVDLHASYPVIVQHRRCPGGLKQSSPPRCCVGRVDHNERFVRCQRTVPVHRVSTLTPEPLPGYRRPGLRVTPARPRQS